VDITEILYPVFDFEFCKENETEIMKVKRENIAVKAKLSEMETDIRTFKNERGNHYWT
jgi:hypothetical protein